jgi:glycosyltransferase involved in cell wall biosynthesis
MKLFIFESHPVQYHAPVYRELHRLCKERRLGSIRVFYATDVTLRGHFDGGFRQTLAWDEPLLENYPAGVLKLENGIPLNGFNSLSGKGIFSLLRRERPDAILLTGLAYRFDWTVYIAAALLRIPIWIRTETQDQAFARSSLKSVLRAWMYRLIYSRVEKALIIGKLNAEHYQKHGIPSSRLVRSPYCVVDRFQKVTDQQARNWRIQIRRDLGFSEDVTLLLFCGKLQTKKYPDALIEALAMMPTSERCRFGVLYVGSGELESSIRIKARTLGTPVQFAGFRNQTELPPFYFASDILVLPSRQMGETWGLVVNEALLAGLRVIVSRHVGCHADFETLPGFKIFDGTSASLVAALREMPASFSRSRRSDFLHGYSVEAAARGIGQAMGLTNEVELAMVPNPAAPARLVAAN